MELDGFHTLVCDMFARSLRQRGLLTEPVLIELLFHFRQEIFLASPRYHIDWDNTQIHTIRTPPWTLSKSSSKEQEQAKTQAHPAITFSPFTECDAQFLRKCSSHRSIDHILKTLRFPVPHLASEFAPPIETIPPDACWAIIHGPCPKFTYKDSLLFSRRFVQTFFPNAPLMTTSETFESTKKSKKIALKHKKYRVFPINSYNLSLSLFKKNM